MRRGFTILELLVASLLLAMLVTILTMLFNQSSVAWRTGVAGTLDLDDVRVSMGEYHDVADDALPGLAERNVGSNPGNRSIRYRTVSLWDDNGTLRGANSRAFADVSTTKAPSIQMTAVQRGTSQALGSGTMRGGEAFIVGVRSLGPDKQVNTDDDITTYPEEVD
jgi:prepilin-type N-terminal cleavage/methylation domain-containing protein